MEAEGEEEVASKILPVDLVERIIAMMPFPSVFKARALSKSWRAKFSPAKIRASSSSSYSSRAQADDRKAEEESVSFQRQVSEWSTSNWQTFCPVFLSKENFIAYDRVGHNWRTMPSLSHLPENLVMARSNLQMEGALLYGYARSETRTRKKELYVANILTGSWKQLPPRPNASVSVVLCNKLVVTGLGQQSSSSSSSLEAEPSMLSSYKLVMVCREHRHDQFNRYSAQIYDSKSDGWSSKRLVISSDFFRLTTAAYHNGVLYMVADVNPVDLLAFNVDDGTFEEHKMPFIDIMPVISVNLVVCDCSLLMIVTEGFQNQQNQQILRIDLDSWRLLEVARGPPAHLDLGAISTYPVGDGSCIFFGWEEGSGSRVLAYDMHEGEWSSFPFLQPASVGHPSAATAAADRRYRWSASSFRPGLSPFATV